MNRRSFLINAGSGLLAAAHPAVVGAAQNPGAGSLSGEAPSEPTRSPQRSSGDSDIVTLFLCGDVMTGRGIDQLMAHPSDPRIYESYVQTAVRYVELGESVSGRIERPVDFSYIWGDALEEFERIEPDVRIINLETSVTRSDDYWRGKGINYRMHPDNIPCIPAAGIDCCVLANNHVLDWRYAGLEETLDTLREAGLEYAGAGRDIAEAEAPAVMDADARGRVIVFGFGSMDSGVPSDWAASAGKPGVNLLGDLSDRTVRRIAKQVEAVKRRGDIVIASIHWGSNWGYGVPSRHQQFAHALIEEADVDAIHGHSSHHPKGIEVHRGRPIIYGCGDFINDYEGIGGYELYRAELGLMYFPRMDASTGRLVQFDMTPTRISRFRVNRAGREDAQWLAAMLRSEGQKLGTDIELTEDSTLALRWSGTG